MRRIWIAAAALVALLLAVLVAAGLLLDADDLRGPLQATLESNLGRSVEFGALDVDLLPRPAVRVDGVRVSGERPGASPLAEVASIRLLPSILPLLFGQVVVRTLELVEPRIHLEVDDEGVPKAPSFDAGPAPADAAPAEETSGGPALAIDSIRIQRGRLEAGPWVVDALELEGGLRLDGSARFDLEAELVGLGRLEGVTADVTGLLSPPLEVNVEGRAGALDLAALAERLELEGLAGTTGARFSATVLDGEVTAGKITLEDATLDYRTEALAIAGPVSLAAELAGPFALDLSAARIEVPDVLSKPEGGRLAVAGQLPAGVPPERLGDVVVEVASSSIPLDVDLAGPAPVASVGATALEIEPLTAWLVEPPEGIVGRIQLERMKVVSEPLSLDGSGSLDSLQIALEGGPAIVTGPFRAAGTRIDASPLDIALGGEHLKASVRYDLETGRYGVETNATDAQAEALVRAITGRPDVSGLLGLQAKLEGSGGIETVSGRGRFQLRDGELQGESLARQVLGPLVALPMLVGNLRGKDLSQYLDNEFQEVSASYTLERGVVRTKDLLIVQRGTRIELAGSVGVVDGALDLRGRLVIGEELDRELGGSGDGSPKVIPIDGVGGTITRPRVVLNQRVLANVGRQYLLGDDVQKKLGERLEETLGEEGGRAVKGLLDQLLRGPKPKQEESP